MGVIVYCKAQGFLQLKYALPEDRLRAFSVACDMDELTERLQAFERICAGKTAGGPIGKLSIAERFRWLTSTRSTVIQPSPVHPGLCVDAAEMLVRLFDQLVA